MPFRHIATGNRQFLGHRAPLAIALTLSGALSLSSPPLAGADPPPHLEFLHALQDRGFGEVAVAYAKSIDSQADLPEEVRQVLELELAMSLRVASEETVNEDESIQYLAEAEARLEKFLAAQPDHLQAADAYYTHGDVALTRGLRTGRQAAAKRDPVQQQSLQTVARASFEQARPRFAKAVELYLARMRALSAAPPETAPAKKGRKAKEDAASRKQTAARERAESQWLDGRFKLASIDYNIGRTYPAEAAERQAALSAASLGFDGIYQQYRTFRPGLVAHMWQGRTQDELGDFQTALDIYDEVLANAPEGNDKRPDPAFESLFAEVEHFRLTILARLGKQPELLEEAQEWLKDNRAATRTSGYQGVALLAAKARIALAEAMPVGPARRTAFQATLSGLADIAKVQTEHRQEAILLRRQYASQGDTELATFDEAVAVGEAAAQSGVWDEAAVAYRRAVELGPSAKDQEKVNAAQMQLARALSLGGKPEEALEAARKLAMEQPDSPLAPPAAALGVALALNLYVAAADKPAAEERLLMLTDYTVKTWPRHAEADDARIALGKLKQVRGDAAGAALVFEAVNPASDRFPQALQLAAQARWRLYQQEKLSPAVPGSSEAGAAHKAKAVEQLTASIQAQRAKRSPDAPPDRTLAEALTLLGEIHLESGEAALAAPLLETVVDGIKLNKQPPADAFTVKVFLLAWRAFTGVADWPRAQEVAALLVELGPDTPQVNAVLASFARTIGGKSQEASAAGDGPTAAATHELSLHILDALTARQQHDLPGLIAVGDLLAAAGRPEKAREQYQRILAIVKQDPAAAAQGEKAVTRVRAQLVGLLRAEKKFPEALAEVEQLMADNPRSLDAMMEKGRVLQAWGEAEPARLPEAVVQWTKVRSLLQRSKKKPPEYYEAIYNTATCLVAQSPGDKEKASQAAQILKSALVLNPNLTGPEMVEKYKALLAKAEAGK